jgi:hypothetical protein
MDPIRPSDDLTVAVSAWLDFAIHQLNQERLDVLRACITAEGGDVQIVARLREGAIILEGISAGQRVELFREDVGSLRRDEGLAIPYTSGTSSSSMARSPRTITPR